LIGGGCRRRLVAVAALVGLGCLPLGGGCAAAHGPADESQGGDDGKLFNPNGSSCDEAAASRSYIGCDFWPTVTANPVWSVFDYAVVVANGGVDRATVDVTRGDTSVARVEIGGGELKTIYLPWVSELKARGEADACYRLPQFTETMFADDGAYHLVSSTPVTVYQFSALEYRGEGGPADKDWSTCPGYVECDAYGYALGCFSFSNDASLLLPTTAMTGNYRVTATTANDKDGGFVTITATRDATEIFVQLSRTAAIAAGDGVEASSAGGSANLILNRGDVVQLIGTPGSDFSGSLVSATQPIQVLAGMPCLSMPFDAPACDHLEETVLPAETLGTHYFVVQPTGPNGVTAGHVVRLYGNFDDTTLSYPSGKPEGAPATLQAGDAVDLGVVSQDFEVVGDQAFAVASFMLGGSIVDKGAASGEQRGDPAQSVVTAVEQFRSSYVFLAPNDYDVNFVDVVMPLAASVTLDGRVVEAHATPIGSSSFGTLRLELSRTTDGSHTLTGSEPVGIQVAGYGAYTSYYYPGGLDLRAISPPPVN
jgi:hypothetical protein